MESYNKLWVVSGTWNTTILKEQITRHPPTRKELFRRKEREKDRKTGDRLRDRGGRKGGGVDNPDQHFPELREKERERERTRGGEGEVTLVRSQ